MNTKKWYEYTQEERSGLERNRYQYIETFLKLTDKILQIQMKINHPEIYPRTNTHKKNLARSLEQKYWAKQKIADCVKHLKIIWSASIV